MFRIISVLTLVVFLYACHSSPDIPGFDKEAWLTASPCSKEKMDMAELIASNEELLLSYTQPEIEALLGSAPKHELFNRNEKFFYYPITKECEGTPDKSLFLRFDALGRAKEVIIIFD